MRVPANLAHFWVVVVVSNSPRFERRYELVNPFIHMLETSRINYVLVEQAFGDRPWMVTDARRKNHVRLRSSEELWFKENLVSIGVRHIRQNLDPNIQYLSWNDYDIYPMRAPVDWFEETWQQLQHFRFVQMFEEFFTLDSNHNVLGGPSKSFMGSYFALGQSGPMPNAYCRENPKWCYQTHAHHRHQISKLDPSVLPPGIQEHSGENKWFGPPGGAWACDIQAWDQTGGTASVEHCILGSGDWHLCCALLSCMNPKDPEMINHRYTQKLLEMQTRCDRWIKQDVGVVRGACYHLNHGPMVNRQYRGRKQILITYGFNPDEDLKHDSYGQLMLETHTPRQIELRNAARQYFQERQEDMLEFKVEIKR
jgi:hypothetical protein